MTIRNICVLLILAACASTVSAQAPEAFNYQGVARDASGAPLAGQPVAVRYILRSGTVGGPSIYEETHVTVTDPFGVFSLHVGEGAATLGTFSSVDWSAGPYFLEVGVDISSSGSYVNVGTQQLLSVPYALHAGSSGDLPQGTEVGQIMHWDGAAWVADSGLYVYQKRFGIGDTAPECPLSIKGEPGQDDRMVVFVDDDASMKWNINLNPSPNDVPGFSIDDASSGSGTSRLFIADSTGNVGIGTTEPGAPLSIKSRSELYEEFQNGDIPEQNDFYFTTGNNTGFAIEEDTVGGTASRIMIQSGTGHVGVGSDDPPAVFAIESRDILKTYFETSDIPLQDNFGIGTDSTGFSIGQGAPTSQLSRLFVEKGTGMVGIGTTEPDEQLHIENSSSNDLVGMRIRNTATTANAGWKIGHVQDSVPARDGAMMVFEDNWPQSVDQDFNDVSFMILPGGNVGINEGMPDTKLHVSRDLADPNEAVSLSEGTGIMIVGPSTRNLVFDSHQIQVRHSQFQGGGAGLTDYVASGLGLQPMGGDILIHGDSAMSTSQKVIITDNGRLGLGTIMPAEKIDIDGAIKIGNTTNNNDGTIRWTGTDFEGRKGGSWTSLTTHTNTDGLWVSGSPGEIHYSPPAGGEVGIGTPTPQAKLHVSGANDGGNVSIMVENIGSSTDGGWLMSAVDDNTVPERMKTFAIHEKIGAELTERITVLSSTGNVGINEGMPDTKLHVSRPVGESGALVDLLEGTGIAVIGPMTNNIALDYKGIQARTGTLAVGGSLTVETGTLDLQRLGGDLLVHGSALTVSDKAILTSDAKLGLGTITPAEKLHVNGALVIGNTSTASPAPGSIRFNGTNFETWNVGDWAIFEGTQWEKVDNTDRIYYDAGTSPRVGIGTSTVSATLHVSGAEDLPDGSTTAFVNNISSMANMIDDHYLLGLRVSTTGSGGGGGGTRKSIGLYVSDVSGQSAANRNLAAVLNGNTVIGDLVPNGNVVGANGTNVLAIQNGTAPTTVPGSTTGGGIQIYSDMDLTGVSTFHIMNGNGEVIKLYKEAALTPVQNLPVDAVYDPSEAIVIENMRTRINQLESVLKNLGLLTP